MCSRQYPKRKFKSCRRYNVPGDAHSLTFTCYHRRAFLSKDRTCQWLADTIAQRADAMGIRPLSVRIYARTLPSSFVSPSRGVLDQPNPRVNQTPRDATCEGVPESPRAAITGPDARSAAQRTCGVSVLATRGRVRPEPE